MDTYDYREVVTDDIRDYFSENDIHLKNYDERDDLYEEVYDALINSDSVTGNASGSYFCNAYEAEEALCHNWDLLADALGELGDTDRAITLGAETCDVIVRCYLVSECLNDVIDEMEDEEEYNDPYKEEDDEEDE